MASGDPSKEYLNGDAESARTDGGLGQYLHAGRTGKRKKLASAGWGDSWNFFDPVRIRDT